MDQSRPRVRETRILSAADENFKRTLWQYLHSAERQGIAQTFDWVVYDLGLLPASLERLRVQFPWCIFKRFDFESSAPHIAIRRGNYAWKPLIVAIESLDHFGVLFWFDCATVFATDLNRLADKVRQASIWYLRGNATLAERSDHRSLAAMGIPAEVLHQQEIVSGAIGFLTSDKAIRELIVRWKTFAEREEVIDPQPRQMTTHKYDQALLGGLILKAVRAGQLPLLHEEIDISSSHPARDISTRNKVANWVPLAAAPLVRFYYSSYKFLDRHWLATSRSASKKLGGLRRHLIERFQVTVHDLSTGLTRCIPSPRYGYFADPFVWQKNGKIVVFAEMFECARDQGRLVVMTLDGSLNVQSCAPIQFSDETATIDCHASFPFVFEHESTLFMLPETCKRRSVDLYRCEKWPDEWRLVRRIMFDVDAADSILVQKDGVWWLLTSVADGAENRHLEVYSMKDLLHSEPVPHPMNGVRMFGDLSQGTGRSAGFVQVGPDGSVIRLMQKSSHFYGEGAAFRCISHLDLRHFAESDDTEHEHLFVFADVDHCHHISTHGNLVAWDRRTRLPFLRKFGWKA